MAYLQVKNRAKSALATNILAGDTSLNVVAGEGFLFPTSNFVVTILNERILVGTRTTDTFSSLTRGYDGTTAAGYNAGEVVELRIIAKHIEELQTGKADLISPAIANIAPAADFTLTQNSVVPFTSVEAGAVANTLVLKEGNVGIGTTNPSARLEVSPSSTSGIALKVGRISGNPSIRGISDTDWLIADAGTSGKFGLNFWSTGDVVLANGGGNVGIGIITSGSKLQVAGNVAIGYSASTAGPTNGLAISGKVGIGTTSPTAVLHLKAGTATASTAPLKLTSGTLNTTPEAGAIEFDGTNLYFVNSSGTRKQLAVV